ncbi:hypothetical protein, conserved [Leishmania tarentolae]|uniref:J domain-containing protein n=1 Tax=Leishmania tarentolae TaxID=5689 RepID=A0A640K960_LEITA|nr:hypothetical protein, conserved [Leishmania tarentolae]
MRLLTRMTVAQVCGGTRAMRTDGVSFGLASTVYSCRCVSSGSSQHERHPHQHVTADDLRAALRTLGLAEDSTDAEVKRAFQAFAIQHHPDTNVVLTTSKSSSHNAGSDTSSQENAAERMRLGTEAYQLLRRIPYEVRQHILRGEGHGSGAGGRGRFRGPHDDNFAFTAEEYAKVQRIYQGDRHRRRRHRDDGRKNDGNGDSDDFFNARTEEGRRRIARLNEFEARVMEMRRRGIRDDLPPWRVYEKDKGTDTASDSKSASRSGGAAGDRHQERHGSGAAGTGPRNPNRMGLHFLNVTAAGLREVRDLYRSRPGFAGMDGSSSDNPHSAARAAPEIGANPHLRQYILMRNRAQEKAIVDRAVGRPILLFLLLACLSAAMMTMAAMARSYRRSMQKDDDLRRRDMERGGA